MPPTTVDERQIKASPDAQIWVKGKAESNSEHGQIMGYASIWDNEDVQGDRVRRGAFTKTIKERVARGKVGLSVKHFRDGGDTVDMIGPIVEAVEDDKGLWIVADLYGATVAQDTREKIRKSPKMYGLSIGYKVIKANTLHDKDGRESGQELLELKLYEVTVTAMPANEKTTARAKGGSDDLEARVTALEQRTDGQAPQDTDTESALDAEAKSADLHAEIEAARRRRLIALAKLGG